ncbi:MAG: HEAT repeat domain-containing protein [Armatimonadetes bacterium]|nr:HEAT repeat domain-containing protein [Armatimonadota bacterium]MDE2207814.1 HEAT repeat domain-containing protein [Armatimonadota bacterium]
MIAADYMADERHVASLADALRRDPEAMVRASAAEALGSIGDPAGVPALLDALNQTYWLVRGMAADSLGNFRSMVCVKALKARLGIERRHYVRIHCHGALVRLGFDEHVEPLAEELYAPRHTDQGVASTVLERVATPVTAMRIVSVALKCVEVRRLRFAVENNFSLIAHLAGPANGAAAMLDAAACALTANERETLGCCLALARSGATARAAAIMAAMADQDEVRRWRDEYSELGDITL